MRETTHITFEMPAIYSHADIKSAIKEILSSKQDRIKEDDFLDTYSQKEIDDDKRMVKRTKEVIDKGYQHLDKETIQKIKDGKEHSEAAEKSIIFNIEENDWLGPKALSKQSADYDDFFNNVDAIVEFDLDEVHRITITIDASINPDIEKIKKKIEENIKKLTEQKKPTKVKYFQSQIDDTKGELSAIVPIIVGAQGKNINTIIALHAKFIELSKEKNKTESQKKSLKDVQKKLAEHPIQKLFIEEMLMQLEMYQRIFKKKNYNNYTDKYIDQISKTINILNNILLDKREMKDFYEIDGVYESTREICNKY